MPNILRSFRKSFVLIPALLRLWFLVLIPALYGHECKLLSLAFSVALLNLTDNALPSCYGDHVCFYINSNFQSARFVRNLGFNYCSALLTELFLLDQIFIIDTLL